MSFMFKKIFRLSIVRLFRDDRVAGRDLVFVCDNPGPVSGDLASVGDEQEIEHFAGESNISVCDIMKKHRICRKCMSCKLGMSIRGASLQEYIYRLK